MGTSRLLLTKSKPRLRLNTAELTQLSARPSLTSSRCSRRNSKPTRNRLRNSWPSTRNKDFETYKKFAIKNLNKNFANAKVQAAKMAKQTGHMVLRGVHSGIVAIDSIDTKKMSRQARDIASSMSKYVDLDTKNMKLTINIPHNGAFQPTFTASMKNLKRQAKTMNIRVRRAAKQVSKEMTKQAVRVQKVVEEVKRKAMQSKVVKDARMTMKTMQTRATELQGQITDKTISLYEKLMSETTEIRRDIMMIIKADTQLVKHIYNELKQLSVIYYKKAH